LGICNGDEGLRPDGATGPSTACCQKETDCVPLANAVSLICKGQLCQFGLNNNALVELTLLKAKNGRDTINTVIFRSYHTLGPLAEFWSLYVEARCFAYPLLDPNRDAEHRVIRDECLPVLGLL
jgi:hypothetical protein